MIMKVNATIHVEYPMQCHLTLAAKPHEITALYVLQGGESREYLVTVRNAIENYCLEHRIGHLIVRPHPRYSSEHAAAVFGNECISSRPLQEDLDCSTYIFSRHSTILFHCYMFNLHNDVKRFYLITLGLFPNIRYIGYDFYDTCLDINLE